MIPISRYSHVMFHIFLFFSAPLFILLDVPIGKLLSFVPWDDLFASCDKFESNNLCACVCVRLFYSDEQMCGGWMPLLDEKTLYKC